MKNLESLKLKDFCEFCEKPIKSHIFISFTNVSRNIEVFFCSHKCKTAYIFKKGKKMPSYIKKGTITHIFLVKVASKINELFAKDFNIITTRNIRKALKIESNDRTAINLIWRNLQYLENLEYLEKLESRRPTYKILKQIEVDKL